MSVGGFNFFEIRTQSARGRHPGEGTRFPNRPHSGAAPTAVVGDGVEASRWVDVQPRRRQRMDEHLGRRDIASTGARRMEQAWKKATGGVAISATARHV